MAGGELHMSTGENSTANERVQQTYMTIQPLTIITFWPIDANEIFKIKTSSRLDEDIIAWQPEKSGQFTVRSAYYLAFSNSPDQCEFAATSTRPEGKEVRWQRFWAAKIPPKVKTYAFKAASNALATEKNKRMRGIEVTGVCMICGMEVEDTMHARYRVNGIVGHITDKFWTKPPAGWVKLNCDGSDKVEDGTAGARMVLRDENGGIIFSACRQLVNCSDPFEAEARACEEGLSLSMELCDKPVMLDCKVLIDAINEKSQDRSPLAHLLAIIKEFCKGTRVISIVKVDRSQNRVSHCLANLARTEGRSHVWLGSRPENLSQVFAQDLLVSPII
jgi:ribonuclease HI